MKKIVIDARIINSTTGRYIERLLTYLEKIDHTNEYIVLVPTKDLGYWKPTVSNFTLKACDYKSYSLGEQLGFAWQLYKLGPDLVHFCMPQQPLFYFGKKVTTVHDLTLIKTYNSDKNWFAYHIKQSVGKVVLWLIPRTSRVVLTSADFTTYEYAKYAHVNKRVFNRVYLAADTHTITPKKYDLPFKKYALYVGQQSDYKNIKKLIEAHQIVLKKQPDLGLVLVGSLNKPAQVNKDWAEKSGYKNVLFTGFVDDNKLAWLYKNTQVYVFPSLMEGFGLPPLEAMTYGAPVVSSNATCLPEVNGDAALYFNPHNIREISEKIQEVLNNESTRNRLIKAGYAQVKKYSWEDTAKQTLAVYEKALTDE